MVVRNEGLEFGRNDRLQINILERYIDMNIEAVRLTKVKAGFLNHETIEVLGQIIL